MSLQLPSSRKQRTRQHVIADQSVNHVERFVLDQGHTIQRLTMDYGYDLVMMTYDEQGYAEPGLILLQLKASDSLSSTGDDWIFDLDIRDYNLWKSERSLVLLILYDASTRKAYWLDVKQYFGENPKRRPKKGAKSVRVRVSQKQVFNHKAVERVRALSHAYLQPFLASPSDD